MMTSFVCWHKTQNWEFIVKLTQSHQLKVTEKNVQLSWEIDNFLPVSYCV